MEAEKSIVNLWLNSKGFFIINDINAGKSVIDILAIKFSEGKSEKVKHVEVSCSLKGELPASEYQRIFESAEVKKKISQVLLEYVGSSVEYENVLVTNAKIPKEALHDITIIPFSKVISEVISSVDSQNYRNTVTRSIQLFKYIFLKPDMIKDIGGKRFEKALKSIAISGIDNSEVVKIAAGDEILSEKVLRKSVLRKEPKKMALLMKKMFYGDARKELVDEIISPEKRAKAAEKPIKEKSLKLFYK